MIIFVPSSEDADIDFNMCDYYKSLGYVVHYITDNKHLNNIDRCCVESDALKLHTSIPVIIASTNGVISSNSLSKLRKELLNCFGSYKNSRLYTMYVSKDGLTLADTKVFLNAKDDALWFTKYAYSGNIYKHINIYGCYVAFLNRYKNLPNRFLETMESLAQMRVLENDLSIKCIGVE